MSDIRCPGAEHTRGAPELEVKECPGCGKEIEVFSSESEEKCPHCGFVGVNEAETSRKWGNYGMEKKED